MGPKSGHDNIVIKRAWRRMSLRVGDLIKINVGDGITRAEFDGVSDVLDEVIGVYLDMEIVYQDFYIVEVLTLDGRRKTYAYDHEPNIEVLREK